MKHLLALLLLPLLSCSDAQLLQLPDPPDPIVDDKLSVTGEVCSQDPEDLSFPLRVLFLVDASTSMQETDPVDPKTGETGRERAVRETIEQLMEADVDVKVSIVRFSSQAQPLTAIYNKDGTFASYFTDDLEYARNQVPYLQETDRTTNFVAALSEAYTEVRDELQGANQESLSQSTYQVILITDGIPDAETDETSYENETILDQVDALMTLEQTFHVGELSLNTAFLESDNAEVNAVAEDLLGDMAEHGDGAFRKFATGGELNFLYVDLSTLKRVFTLRTLVATNMNAQIVGDDVLSDADGDNLSDRDELLIGTNVFVPDSDGDGCRDGIEARYVSSGLDPLVDDCNCFVPEPCLDEDKDGQCDNGCTDADKDTLCDCIDADGDGLCDPENYPDGDGDGLTDCEEIWSGSKVNGADTDSDGLVDYLEVRFGTAPDVDDIEDDSDWDAVENGEEVRTGTDPEYASTKGRYDLAYQYELLEVPNENGAGNCYQFQVDNITLVEPETTEGAVINAGPAGQGYSGSNRVLIYAGEVPFDDLESYARFRVACVEARFRAEGNYRNPPSGKMALSEADFVDVTEFDGDLHCVAPEGETATGTDTLNDTGGG